MSAQIIPFPQAAAPTPERPDIIQEFYARLEANRAVQRKHGRFTGLEWLEIMDLERDGMPLEQAARMVRSRR